MDYLDSFNRKNAIDLVNTDLYLKIVKNEYKHNMVF